MTTKQIVLAILGVLFVINLFFRMRVMKLMTEIKKHNIRVRISDLTNNANFKTLIETSYPEHAELLTKYRSAMMTGILLIVVVVLGLAIYVLINPS